MERIICLICFIFALAFVSLAQTAPCPKISVIGPSDFSKIGGYMTFTVNLSGGNFDKISYNWVVDKGGNYYLASADGNSNELTPIFSQNLSKIEPF